MANGKCDYGEMVTFRTAKVTISDKGLPHADGTDYYRMAAEETHFKSRFPTKTNIMISTENIASSAELWVKKCAQEDVPGVTTKIGQGRNIDIMLEGEKIATCEIAFKPELKYYNVSLPDGNCGQDLRNYTWDDFAKLDEAFAKQNEAAAFAGAIADLSNTDMLEM